MKTILPRSIDVILSLEGVPLGGQQNASFTQNAMPVEITNQIKSDWKEYLTKNKGWSVKCNGLYIVNDESFKVLEDAFMTNKIINISLMIAGGEYQGQVLITDFPLVATFDREFKYSLQLLGTGALKRVS